MCIFILFSCRVGVIKMELAQQIKADFEESFQGPNAKVEISQFCFIFL